MIKVSVLIPVWNQEELVIKALDHLPRRDDMEIIVRDDGSTDNTLANLKQYKEEHPDIEISADGSVDAGKDVKCGKVEGGVDAGDTELARQDLLYDPQTAGGLLMAVAPEHADALFEELKHYVPSAQRIGTVAEYTGGKRIMLR